MKILCLGDVVGPTAVSHISKNLWSYRAKEGIDFVVANCENADEGNGLSASNAEYILSRGVDVITTGNHVWRQNSLRPFLDSSDCIVRPLNYPGSCPGKGYTVAEGGSYRILVMNVQGTVYMESLACPFESVEKALEINKGRYDFALLDIHAEATSEKLALARYFDGRVNVIFGTHTHVQTFDLSVLEKGSGYITDLGMCGVQNGILGVEEDIIIQRMKNKMPVRHLLKKGDALAKGAIFELDCLSGRVTGTKYAEF